MLRWLVFAWLGLVAGCARSTPIGTASTGSGGDVSIGSGGYGGLGGAGIGGSGIGGAGSTMTGTGTGAAVCGDGHVDPGEECDDGNMVDNDGCTLCQVDCEPQAVKNPANHHCYRVFQIALASPAAEMECETWGGQTGLGHLVSIGDANEETFVMSLMSGAAWIGGGDTPQTPGMWKWYDGTPFTYTHWAPNEPNSPATETCIYMHADGTWDDHVCTATWPAYICERRAAGLKD